MRPFRRDSRCQGDSCCGHDSGSSSPQRLHGHSKQQKRLTLEEKQEIGSSFFVLSNSSRYISIHTLNVHTRNSFPYPASFSLVSCTSHQHPSPLQPTVSHHWLRIRHSWESEVRCSWESEVPVSPRQLASARRCGMSDHHRLVSAFPHGIHARPRHCVQNLRSTDGLAGEIQQLNQQPAPPQFCLCWYRM